MSSKEKNEHCCDYMDYYCRLGSDVEYNPRMRRYDLKLNGASAIEYLFYCPWCGKKLPKFLNDEWDEIIGGDLGLLHPFFEDKDKVPKEFWTDEWWKKRGL